MYDQRWGDKTEASYEAMRASIPEESIAILIKDDFVPLTPPPQ